MEKEKQENPSYIQQLKDARKEYRLHPDIPALVTSFWEKFIQAGGADAFKNFGKVPDCPFDSDQLNKERDRGFMPIYMPEGLTLHDVGLMFPEMRRDGDEGYWASFGLTALKDEDNLNISGKWIFVSFSPVIMEEVNPEKAVKNLREKGMEPCTLSAFILASQASYLLLGEYIDRNEWVWLLGTKNSHEIPVHARIEDRRTDEKEYNEKTNEKITIYDPYETGWYNHIDVMAIKIPQGQPNMSPPQLDYSI